MKPAASSAVGKPYLSVVVPVRDAEAGLPGTIAAVADHLDARGIDSEIVVVVDGSPDRASAVTRAALRGRRGRIVNHAESRGEGAAVRTGVLAAGGRWVLILDPDLPVPIEAYDRLAEVCRERDLDGAIGSRAGAESGPGNPSSASRPGRDRAFNAFVRLATGLPFRDVRCGFKLLDRRRALPLFEQMVVERDAWPVELLFLCARLGLAIVEVPVAARVVDERRVGGARDLVRRFVDVLRVRWRFRRGDYRGSS